MAEFFGARVYKLAVKAGKTTTCPDEPVQVDGFYKKLLEQVFGDEDDFPKVLKPKKGQAFGDIPNNAFSKVAFGATDYDHGGYVVSTQPTRLVVPTGKDGLYTVTASLHTGMNVKLGGFIYSWLVKGTGDTDTECLDMKCLGNTVSQDNTLGPLLWTGPLKAGEHVSFVILHALGAALSEGMLKFGTSMSLDFRGTVGTSPTPPPGPNPTPTPVGKE